MPIPWQRLLRALPFVSQAACCVLLMSLAGSVVLAPTTALAAASRSHVHHSGLAALPPSSFVETGAARTGRKRKGATRSAGAARGAAAAPRSRGSKARRGRGRRPEPAEDIIPMYRASRGAGRHDRESAQRGTSASQNRSRHIAEELAWARSGRRGTRAEGHTARRLHEDSRAGSAAGQVASASPSRSKPADRAGFAVLARTPETETPVRQPAAPGTNRVAAYAEGISHPADDERQPGPASFDAVEEDHSPAPGARPQVVQGLGGEVAIAGDDTGRTAGATRRRNHPISAAALGDLNPPPSLEERTAITEAAVSPAVLPEVYDRDGRLVMPAPLKGSRVVLLHQNTMAASDGLGRIRDDGELDRLRAEHMLVSFPLGASLRINEELPLNRRYARPWTVLFAGDIARDFYSRFHQPIQVNSAVRTVNYQARLERVNGNAAATYGEAASPHLTGQAIDLGKRGMTAVQLAWMRAYLLPLMEAGKIDVEEEFQQACFHISVYRRYGAGRPVHEVAQLRPAAASSQAAEPVDESAPEDTP